MTTHAVGDPNHVPDHNAIEGRLDALEVADAGAPNLSLSDLQDVSAGAPTTSDVLSYTGSEWAPGPAGLQKTADLADLGDVMAARANLGLGSAALAATGDFDVAGAADAEATARAAAITTAIADLVNSAPGTMDTLAEIAALLASGESTAAALATTVAGKLAQSANLSDLADVATAKTNLSLVKADVGLGSASDTSDANKPISTATQAALGLKAKRAHAIEPARFGLSIYGAKIGPDCGTMSMPLPVSFGDYVSRTIVMPNVEFTSSGALSLQVDLSNNAYLDGATVYPTIEYHIFTPDGNGLYIASAYPSPALTGGLGNAIPMGSFNQTHGVTNNGTDSDLHFAVGIYGIQITLTLAV